MPANLFHELNKDKKQTIISVGIAEFGKHGYTDSSTNRIVKNSGISKGSLFKYFESKEELYFYLLDCVTEELVSSFDKMRDSLPDDLFERIIKYSEFEFSWYIQNPEKYNLIIKAFSKNDTDIYRKTETRYNYASQDIYNDLLADIDTTQFKWSKEKTSDVLRWFLKGFNEDFVSRSIAVCENINLDIIKNEYVKCLTDYMEILKQGFLQ